MGNLDKKNEYEQKVKKDLKHLYELPIEEGDKKDFDFIKEEMKHISRKINPKLKITSQAEFREYIKLGGIGTIKDSTLLGKYLRTYRYENIIREQCEKQGVSFDEVFGLLMTESYGDPVRINTTDGGAGISQFQADVAREWGMKVFTDLPEYRNLNIPDAYKTYQETDRYKFLLRVSKESETASERKKYRDAIYKDKRNIKFDLYGKQAEALQKILSDKRLSLDELAKLDDRFNAYKSIPAAVKYIKHIKDKYIDNDKYAEYKNEAMTGKDFKDYREKYDIERLLATNGYNKGPGYFLRNFTDGTHIKHVTNNIDTKRKFDEQINEGIAQGLTGGQVVQLLSKKSVKQDQQTKENTQEKTQAKNREKNKEQDIQDTPQKAGTFKELDENSKGLRLWKYVVKERGTAERVRNLFYERLIVPGLTVTVVNSKGEPYDLTHKFVAPDDKDVYLLETNNEEIYKELLQETQNEKLMGEERVIHIVEKNIIKLHKVFQWNEAAITLPDGYFLPPEYLNLSKQKFNYFIERMIGDMGTSIIMKINDKSGNNVHTVMFSEFSGGDGVTMKIDDYSIRIDNGILKDGDIKEFDVWQRRFEDRYGLLLNGK